ncbi:hypothetical protein CCACVL1_03032 [Corchorus capsularis]|uniref:Uncharacterized protein n=1 Tax=Corchorus capsularis TaxID=210143 RepID=A0A1R3K3L4_COCAP|nr:hypothetical protein CCACVL1_03032 [Corchorus capsularis]
MSSSSSASSSWSSESSDDSASSSIVKSSSVVHESQTISNFPECSSSVAEVIEVESNVLSETRTDVVDLWVNTFSIESFEHKILSEPTPVGSSNYISWGEPDICLSSVPEKWVERIRDFYRFPASYKLTPNSWRLVIGFLVLLFGRFAPGNSILDILPHEFQFWDVMPLQPNDTVKTLTWQCHTRQTNSTHVALPHWTKLLMWQCHVAFLCHVALPCQRLDGAVRLRG